MNMSMTPGPASDLMESWLKRLNIPSRKEGSALCQHDLFVWFSRLHSYIVIVVTCNDDHKSNVIGFPIITQRSGHELWCGKNYGVVGSGMDTALWSFVLLSTTVVVFEVVMDGKLLTTNVFCNFSLCVSFAANATFAFDDTVEEMGQKGCRVKGDTTSGTHFQHRQSIFSQEHQQYSPLLAISHKKNKNECQEF